ncbi:MAG: FtsW/RodA/SpoVE family cell cycle protein [Actinomycetota bacterium]|nr:FtsW/RodA/SpoVE family cell cycle protein [Actinomycetota bacterium]
MTAPALAPPRKTRRGSELFLLIFAVLLAGMVSVAIEGALGEGMTPAPLWFAATLGVMFGITHIAIRLFAPYADPVLFPLVALLNGLGVALIHRLDLADAAPNERFKVHFLTGNASLQLAWTAVGLALLIAVLVIVRDHRVLARYSYTLGLIGLALLAIPALLPASLSQVNGARIWIRVAGFSIQPGEFAKIALIVFFASYLVAKRDVLSLASRRIAGIDFPRGRDLGPVLVAWIASLLVLIFEKDLGSSLLFFGIFIVMLYIATQRTSWLLIGLMLFAGGAFMAWTLFAHVQDRVAIWLHPFKDADDKGFQIVQALYGLATGRLFGTGPGAGRPEIVPYANSDFIVATIGEELGLFGLTAVLVIYALIVARGLRTALTVRDSFGKLLAAGLAFSVGLQVFVVVGGVTKLIPLTGLTTPFLSYGGSSLVANYVLIGLLLRISDAARRPPTSQQAVQPLQNAPTELVRL